MKPPRKDKCDCGILDRWSKEPDHPVRFDPALNEYFIAGKSGGKYQIYYCPFCGGATPEPRRASLFAHITDKEQQRIYSLFSGITTERQVIDKFGKPDEERQVGTMVMYPEKDGAPARGEAFRTLVYKNLSTVADICFNISDGGKARGTWVQKHIGNQDGQPSPRPYGSPEAGSPSGQA